MTRYNIRPQNGINAVSFEPIQLAKNTRAFIYNVIIWCGPQSQIKTIKSHSGN